MKALLHCVVAFALLGCSQSATDETSSYGTPGTDTAATAATTGTASTTDTSVPPTESANNTAPADAPQETSSMSNEYENKVAELHTTAGEIHIRFFPDVAPNHVKNFIDLAKQGFYDNTKFHRIIPGFMIQGGDPNTVSAAPATWGTGGSPNQLKAEFNTVSHRRGIVSMARSQHPDSASSQFFIVVKDSPFLDRQYTVFGEVTKGMDVADKIVNAARGQNDRPNDPVAITKVVLRDAGDNEKGPAPR